MERHNTKYGQNKGKEMAERKRNPTNYKHFNMFLGDKQGLIELSTCHL